MVLRLDINTGELTQLYNSGYSATELSNNFNTTPKMILDRLRNNGVTTRNRQNYVTRRIRNKLINNQKGDKNTNWRGGVSTEEQLLRMSSIYNEWRKAIYERDDYTCLMCYSRGKKLEAHHIKSFAEYPKLRLDLNNGITLCSDCHLKTKTREKLYEKQFLYKIGGKKMKTINRGERK